MDLKLQNAEIEDSDNWYEIADTYWQNQPSTVDGMLGGFGKISKTDLFASRRFLLDTISDYSKETQFKQALDCGAGIGRISKGLLLKWFEVVDLIDQNGEFLIEAKKSAVSTKDHRVGELFACGLQDFTPEPAKYDVIWCQWVLAYLTDDDLIAFLARCKKGLNSHGLIFIKENVTCGIVEEVDLQDSSVTRTELAMQNIFHKAGLTILRQEFQKNFPKGLFPVKMYALM
ncbi:N-terminal Xaa-Pro-Lys N-methyltransferase 1-B [Trichoplax sp. H2]|uniref:Alpha N-terminal protein methyltransferase 1 n=1 Tax=Trichoplax adhaerens TaxID=10228 RepID=B3RRM8_TRIAD|nr:hypothetical protein TRIADDRAFT_49985 [Trichoplax adhaerens]EDV26379.1 hypothetical protein TRIADDRAFT_49985 [Trichoplax adhaerens]RDD39709.1 N-terminal Xaa-Pro-Lys N-methyltransferase 1-B [Trichoplax sp. H2]|eukprot:XP_002110375.1 hypothetical protein TRIADDRAFT_49985 [Trichoplax adhaerens]